MTFMLRYQSGRYKEPRDRHYSIQAIICLTASQVVQHIGIEEAELLDTIECGLDNLVWIVLCIEL